MDYTTRLRLERNIFHAAHQACEPWEQFRWHTSRGAIDTHVPHASQALAIDVFGTIKMSPAREEVKQDPSPRSAHRVKSPFPSVK
jgi:hypothetical protein